MNIFHRIDQHDCETSHVQERSPSNMFYKPTGRFHYEVALQERSVDPVVKSGTVYMVSSRLKYEANRDSDRRMLGILREDDRPRLRPRLEEVEAALVAAVLP